VAAALGVGASIVLLAGCGSATDGSGSSAAQAGAARPAAATSAAAPSITDLATRVAAAVAGATSVHVTGSVPAAALPVPIGEVDGDVALSSGKPTAAAVTAGKYALRYVDGTAWVTLPGADAAKPWTVVSPNSSNPVVAMAASKLGGLQDALNGLDPSKVLSAASDLEEVGPAQVGGAAATEYSFTVDPAALAGAFGVADSRAAGLGPVPVQLWLDGSDRPVKLTANPTVKGEKTPVTVALSKWNAPVSIAAPDPSTVSS
jgi:hypothetical protein